MKVNVIIVSYNGILDTPMVILDDTTAQAEFDNLVNELVPEEDREEIRLHFDSQVDDLNSLINKMGINVDWFIDIEVNKYINQE